MVLFLIFVCLPFGDKWHIEINQIKNYMTTIALHNVTDQIQTGYVTLYGKTGISYHNKALLIPGYGWVPCSKKLQGDFTTNPDSLMLVISDEDDDYRPVTSDIWVTRSNVERTY